MCPQCRQAGELSGRDPVTTPDPAAAEAPAKGGPPGTDRIAPFFPQLEILEFIAAGGMGVVYKARQKGLDRLVALKILPEAAGQDPAFAGRFAREARALALLNHPGIVTIYDFGHAGPYYYLVMEFVDGADLRRLISSGTLQGQGVLGLVSQICEALQFAHGQGVVHRDIKPGNILVDRSGRVKIADFGLAKLLGEDAGDAGLTGTHHVMGTLSYMAPEQRQRSQTVDHRADIYSLGVVIYEMLTGELPVGRCAPPSAKARVPMDRRLDEVVLRTLEPEPGRRFQSAADLQSHLRGIAGAAPNPPGAATGQPMRRPASRWVPVAAAAAVVATVVGIPWLLPGPVVAVLEETPPQFGHATTDSRWFNYRLMLPAGHRLTFWIEWWESGRRTNRSDFAVHETLTTARDRPLEGEAALILWHRPGRPGTSSAACEWQWSLHGGGAHSEAGRVSADPFAPTRVRDSSYGHAPLHKLQRGRTATLAVLRGGRSELRGHPWDPQVTTRADVEMHLKARLDAVAASQLSDVPTAGPPVASTPGLTP